MGDSDDPPISTADESSITVRGTQLSTDILGEMDFGGAVYLLLSGEAPTEGERRVTNAILSSLMVHGVTPHSLATRLTLLGEPSSTQGAIASGLLGVGSRFAGAMEECARDLQRVAAAADSEEAVGRLVADYRDRGDPFPGLGHTHFDPVDPRAERLFELAGEGDVTGEHTAALRRVQRDFESAVGRDLPVNVTGAIAALTSDMGFPPEASRGMAVISRAAGLTAAVIDERRDPIAPDVWEYASGDATESADE